ncbi:putative RNA-binding Zn ribbon-like protein [Pseudoduganella lurida]|uniref:Putative RNA-binding Zn ribbon-like protein n=1 Tax=Pseudoduganella lurida TaxID=1036180 RepID=A0A562QWA4_9BURK|nr:ABATE domain-containing protein [Pseudoduganella lurida]TWI60893.1 putative RNA-binding Zn ribbon-like protein [Pseudoduganella lurida]
MNATTQHGNGHGEAPLVGDHLALDLLNTEARSDGVLVDFWQTGDDVLHWLARQGIVPAKGAGPVDLAALLAQGVALRALARRMIDRHREGRAADVGALNKYLLAHASAPQLVQDGEGKLALVRIARGEPVAALLGPVAEALAQLLAEGDFSLVRQCEHPDCILWFYDRTKAHKRRWCSMAACGNRYKAAQFRKRGGAGQAA